MVGRKKVKKEEFYPAEKQTPEYSDFSYRLPQKEVEAEPAPLWRRIVAFLIDYVFVYIVFFQVFLLIYLSMAGIPDVSDVFALQNYASANTAVLAKMVVGTVVLFFIALFYFMLCETIFHATLGKKMLGLIVVSDSGKLDYWQSFVRNLTKTILLPILVFDFVAIMFTEGRRRFTEILAATKVIYYPKLKLVYEGEF